MKKKIYIFLTILILLIAGAFEIFKGEKLLTENNNEETENTQTSTISQPYKVIKIIDGDTLDVNIDENTERIRLIGIDTPETVHPNKPVECFGKEASEKMKTLVEGKNVILETDDSQGNKDKYNRLLRYIFLEDGTNINELMIMEGYAYEYTYNLPYKYQAQFKEAQQYAEKNKLGLWAEGVCDKEKIALPPEPAKELPTELETESLDCVCDKNEKNCKDFTTHKEAQAYYQCCLDAVGYDIHRLDGDSDGLACEGLK